MYYMPPQEVWIHFGKTVSGYYVSTTLPWATDRCSIVEEASSVKADFLHKDLSRGILMTHHQISRVLNTVRDAFPSP